MPLLYRGAPVNSIWEGSGNVAALDVLRALIRQPRAIEAFLAECEEAVGADALLDSHLASLRSRVEQLILGGAGNGDHRQTLQDTEFNVRGLVEDLALALQGSLLVRHAPAPVADAFCAGRIGPARGRAYGTLPAGVNATAIIERALPA